MSALSARAEIVAPGRALVRAGRALEEGGRRRQAGRSGGGGSGRGNGGAPRAAAVRASVGAGQSRDRLGAAGGAGPPAHPCPWAAQGGPDRRRRASGAADRSGSGGQRLAEGARGATSRYSVRADEQIGRASCRERV